MPERGEDVQLQTEENRLAHAEALARAAVGTAQVLSEADVSVSALLSDAQSQLDAVAGHDPALDEHANRLRALLIDADDIASELHIYGSDIDVDPQRLAEVQERRSDFAMLQRKYGPSLDDVLDWAESARQEVSDLDVDESGIAELVQAIEDQTRQVEVQAAEITRIRRDAAARLSSAIETELEDLALEKARVDITVEPAPIGPHGADRVRFLFAANSGTELQPLGQSASGGELSRVMLAIEVVLTDRNPVPTLVFDEVDAGIGGRTAIEVGRKLARLAKNAQIIVVTHLPQVAAFADCHFVVSKNDDGDVTNSSVYAVDESKRIEELARMLSGLEDSETALAHARELLENSRVH